MWDRCSRKMAWLEGKGGDYFTLLSGIGQQSGYNGANKSDLESRNLRDCRRCTAGSGGRTGSWSPCGQGTSAVDGKADTEVLVIAGTGMEATSFRGTLAF